MNAIHYIETSALNLFVDELQDFDLNLFYREAMKVDLCISPIVLWEVLLNSDVSRREALIYWAQFNCAEYLLKSPSEIIIGYLLAGAPLKDRMVFHQNRATTLPLGKTWSDIHRRIDRTLPVDLKELQEFTKPLRDLAKSHNKIIRSMTNENEYGNEREYFHRTMLKLVVNLKKPRIEDKESEAFIKTALMLTFIIACIGLDVDKTPVREFWKPLGIEDPFERLEYLVANMPIAIVRGPLIEMALMINTQSEMDGGTNRGTFFDALHAIYCYYSDNTISNDPHFTRLFEYNDHQMYKNIVRADKYVSLIKLGHEHLAKLKGMPG